MLILSYGQVNKYMLNTLKKIIKTREFQILTAVFIFGLVLRLFNMWDNILIAYDQGRDGQRIYDIIYNHDFKLVGPETDIQGIFNGPIFYYLLVVIYGITGFDLNVSTVFFVLFNLTCVYMLYKIAVILFKNKNIGYIAAFLWAVSYEQISFARFISNASLMAPSSMLMFLGLAIYIFQKKNYGLIVSALGYALAIHFNFYLIYLGILYPILYFIYRPKIDIKSTGISVGLLGVLLSPFLLAEIKFKFLGINSLFKYLQNESGRAANSNVFGHWWTTYSHKVYEALSTYFFTLEYVPILIIFAITLVAAWFVIKEKKSLVFLYIWIFSTAPLFIFQSGVLSRPVINSTIFGAYCVLFAIVLAYLLSKKFFYAGGIIALLFFASNLKMFASEDFIPRKLFFQENMLYAHEKQLMDYTYQQVGEKPFSICAVTNPLFVNSLWSFLYSSYGKPEYGYVPFWSGQLQTLNTTFLPYAKERQKIRFLIIEPNGLSTDVVQTTIYAEDKDSILLEEKMFGNLRVQKRQLTEGKDENRDSQNLSERDRMLMKGRLENDPRYWCNNIY